MCLPYQSADCTVYIDWMHSCN